MADKSQSQEKAVLKQVLLFLSVLSIESLDKVQTECYKLRIKLKTQNSKDKNIDTITG